MSWFTSGDKAVDNANKKGGTGGGSWRFYLKAQGEAKIVFLDGDNTEDEPILNYREHQFEKTGVNAPQYATCVGAAQGCMFCKAGLKPYEAWPFTILVLEPTYTDRDGNEHKNQRKLMVAKKEIMQRILRFREQREGLAGTVWTIYRSTKKAYTIGDDWQFQRKIGGDDKMSPERRRKAVAEWLEIEAEKAERIDYMEELKPKSEDELLSEGADVDATKRRAESWGSGGGGGGSDRGSSGGGGGRGRDASVDYD